jgi:electron transport complex protein RnfB
MILTAVILLAVIALVSGVVLGFAAVYFRVEGNPVAEQIDKLLPQSQCGQCGYPGCRPYAEAIAKNEADINLCPPGGEAGMLALARLLDRQVKPLSADPKPKTVAVIDENLCIGCTLCIQACPVDAILGAAKQMHTVIASECTGCDLCLPPCPVNCIHRVPIAPQVNTWQWPAPALNA